MIRISIMLVCLTGLLSIGCQGTGADQAQLDEVKKQIEGVQEYITEFNVYRDSVLAVQHKLFKLNWRIHPERMERVFGPPTKDTFPFPKPPPPPPYPIEKRVID